MRRDLSTVAAALCVASSVAAACGGSGKSTTNGAGASGGATAASSGHTGSATSGGGPDTSGSSATTGGGASATSSTTGGGTGGATSASSSASSTSSSGATFSGIHAVMGSSGNPGHLADKNGDPVILHGVDESGSENYCLTWGPPPVVLSPANGPSPLTQASITEMKAWGINAVRIPLNEDCWLGINGVAASAGAASYQTPIQDAVNLITQTNGMYVILDLHITAAGSAQALTQQPMADVDHSVTFWQQVAAAYKDNGSVIFDLFNEPNLPGTAAEQYQCWASGSTTANGAGCPMVSFAVAGMQTLVSTVRGQGAENLIILGGQGYASNLGLWPQYVPKDTLTPPNLAASWHVYDDQGGCTSDTTSTLSTLCSTTSGLGAQAVMQAGYPIVVGETGFYSCSGNVGPAWWPIFLSWADAQGIGTVAWSWSNGNNPQLLAQSADFTTNFTPSAEGQVYKTFLGCIAGKTVTPLTSCTSAPATGCE